MKAIVSILVLSFAILAINSPQAATTKAASKRATTMHPKITSHAARAIALAKVPGARVKSYELERESGHLIYSFDLVTPGKSGVDEVHVDAMNGAVLAMVHEGPKAERAELAKEKKEASTPATGH